MGDFASLPAASRYRLINARIPSSLAPPHLAGPDGGLAGADIVVAGGRIEAIVPHGRATRLAKRLDGHVFHGLLQYRINTESVAVY